MKKIVKGVVAGGALIALGASQAFAAEVQAPEIDVGQGLTAAIILFCVALLVREKFFRGTLAKG